MNQVIVIANKKGGSGKSTLFQNLIALLLEKGKSVLAIDIDPTGISTFWSKQRAEKFNESNFTYKNYPSTTSIERELTIIKDKKEFDYIIIDSAGFDSIAMRSAIMSEPNLLLIPSKSTQLDLFVSRSFISEVNNYLNSVNSKTIIRTVLMECDALPSQATIIIDCKEALKKFGASSLNNFTVRRNAYKFGFLTGDSALHDKKARYEISGILNEIETLL